MTVQATGLARIGRPHPPASPSGFERRLAGFLVRQFLYRGRRGGPWSLPDRLAADRIAFIGNSGARLAGLHFRLPEARGMVVLAHPDKRYAKHWFVKHGWIDWLLGHGYEAMAFDFPVYGESYGGSTHLGDDVVAAVRWAQANRPELPVHVIGVSVGAFAAINAGPHIDRVQSMVLESPYPDFESWYVKSGGKASHRWMNRALSRLFPKTYRYIHAEVNIRANPAQRILIAGTEDDDITPIELTRQVAAAAPPNARYLELDRVPHLALFERPEYRQAMLETLQGDEAPVAVGQPPPRTAESVVQP